MEAGRKKEEMIETSGKKYKKEKVWELGRKKKMIQESSGSKERHVKWKEMVLSQETDGQDKEERELKKKGKKWKQRKSQGANGLVANQSWVMATLEWARLTDGDHPSILALPCLPGS